MKTYRSKVDKWLPILLFSLLGAMGTFFVAVRVWLGVAIVMAVLAFILQFFLNTRYTLTADKLLITCGWFYKKEVPLLNIRKIMRTKSLLSAPALSADKLLIFYDRQQVMISPENQEAFLLEIKQLNPRINI